jgi:hypothetical protein
MAKRILIKVTKNNWGNFRGHVTGSPSYEIGPNDWDAKYWARETLAAHPGAVYSELSYFTKEEVTR